MAHDHSHHHDHHHHSVETSGKHIVFAFWINTAFVVIELVGGFFTNSMAILSDALHDLGDSLALGLSYYFHKKSKQKRDLTFNYGYRRFSLLGAFINSFILVISSIFIIQESVKRLATPEQPDAKGMVILSLVGIFANGWAMYRLQKGNSLNEKAVALHFLEDILGWVAVLIGSIVMIFANLPLLDPILSLLISAIILYNVFRNLRATFKILLQAKPETINEIEIHGKIRSIPGVKGIHDVHYWTLDGLFNIMTLHVVIQSDASLDQLQEIKKEIRHCLQHMNIQHMTIEMELEGERCELSSQ